MPPAGFEIIAPVMMPLRDEIAPPKAEVSEQRTAMQCDFRSMERAVSTKHDVDDIKTFIHELRKHERNNSDTFGRIVSGPVLNRSNDSRHISERITSGLQPNNGKSRHHLSQGKTPASLVAISTNLPNNGTGSA